MSRAECPECGRRVLVNADGKLRAHYPDPGRPEARRTGGWCEGSSSRAVKARPCQRDELTGLSERDDLTLRILAILEDASADDIRDRALAAYAARARAADPDIAEIIARARAAISDRDFGAANVIQLRSRT